MQIELSELSAVDFYFTHWNLRKLSCFELPVSPTCCHPVHFSAAVNLFEGLIELLCLPNTWCFLFLFDFTVVD